jgi:transcriptional regulator with XRE-family HTH domain
MTMDPEETFEAPRLLTEAELAEIVKKRRNDHGWSQATLAEIAGVTDRTIQRVENGEPSSPHTRRAIARAFECDDLEVFNKPVRLPNIEKLKAFWDELDRTTIIVPITRIQDARTLRTMSEAARGFAVDELGELSTEAREAFAWIVDELQEYNDVGNSYTMSERLEFDRDIGTRLKTIADAGAAFGAGLKHESVIKSDAPNCEPMNLTNIHFVLAPNDALPPNIREPKLFR